MDPMTIGLGRAAALSAAGMLALCPPVPAERRHAPDRLFQEEERVRLKKARAREASRRSRKANRKI